MLSGCTSEEGGFEGNCRQQSLRQFVPFSSWGFFVCLFWFLVGWVFWFVFFKIAET